MVVLILLEFVLRALVGDRWPWFMIAMVMAAQLTRQGLGSDNRRSTYDPQKPASSSTSFRNNIRAVLAADAPGCVDFCLPR